MKRYDHSVLSALAEQFAFERAQRIAREEHAIKVAADNPDLSSEDLCERLSMTTDRLRRILPKGDLLRRYKESTAVLHPIAPGPPYYLRWRGNPRLRQARARGKGRAR